MPDATSPQNPIAGPTGRRRLVPAGALWRALGPLLALTVVIAAFGIADRWKNGDRSQFLTAQNARTIAAPTAIIVVAALGMTVVIIAGGIDLSAGTALAFCATVLA